MMNRAHFLPYGRQSIDQDDVAAIIEVLKSDYLTTGPLVAKFEAALAALSEVNHSVAVNSGTSALHAAYHAAGLGPGDEIVTTPFTFAATANAALYLGAAVKFVDVSPDTGNIAPELIEEAITEKTKLIVPVDFAGHPADYDSITEVARRHNAVVVADAAHSLGAVYRGRSVGGLADATAVSFHPVKPITTAEGGAVLTNDVELADRANLLRSHGITRNESELERPDEGSWWYEMQTLGYNYRLTDLQCALGLSQLSKIFSFLSRRREIAAKYTSAFSQTQGFKVPVPRPEVEAGWHLYIIRLNDASRRRVFYERLKEVGLGVQVHYIPVHYHPYYRQFGFTRGMYPVAEDFYRRVISLPLFPGMSDDDTDSVIERVHKAAQDLL